MTSKERAQKFHTDDLSLMYPDLGGVSDWLCHAANMLQQSEALQDGLSPVRFLRRYFAGKPGIAKCDRQILLFSS